MKFFIRSLVKVVETFKRCVSQKSDDFVVENFHAWFFQINSNFDFGGVLSSCRCESD